MTPGTSEALAPSTISDRRMYATAMNGTTTEANEAMRFTPPMITNARTMTAPTPTTHVETSHAPFIATAIEFDCTPVAARHRR